jgi:hypothetical protein
MPYHKLLFINSENRTEGQEINDLIVQVNDPQIVGKNVNVYLVNFISRVCIPIVNDYNCSFILNEGGQITTITLTINQSPDWTSLQTELQTKLNSLSPHRYTYTVSNDRTKLHFLLSVSSQNPVSFDFTSDNSSYELLGFEKKVYSFSNQTLESTTLVNLGGELSLFIKIKNGSSNNIEDFTNRPSNTLCIIPNLAPYGSNLFFHNINDDYSILINSINSIEILLTDFYGNKLNFTSNYILTLKIEVIEPIDYNKQMNDTQIKTNDLLKMILVKDEFKNQNINLPT